MIYLYLEFKKQEIHPHTHTHTCTNKKKNTKKPKKYSIYVYTICTTPLPTSRQGGDDLTGGIISLLFSSSFIVHRSSFIVITVAMSWFIIRLEVGRTFIRYYPYQYMKKREFQRCCLVVYIFLVKIAIVWN